VEVRESERYEWTSWGSTEEDEEEEEEGDDVEAECSSLSSSSAALQGVGDTAWRKTIVAGTSCELMADAAADAIAESSPG
jgi:hypothetical protein